MKEILSLMYQRQITGFVLNIDEESTSFAPIHTGLPVYDYFVKYDIGFKDINDNLHFEKGIHTKIYETLKKIPLEILNYFPNIDIYIIGETYFSNADLNLQLQKELNQLIVNDGNFDEIKVHNMLLQKNVAWKFASMCGMIDIPPSCLISYEDYKNHGSVLINKRGF